MRVYLSRRLLQFVAVLWGAATLNFFIPRLAPGDPVRSQLVQMASQGGYLQQGIEAMVQSYDQQFGLDQPLWLQYVRYLGNVLHLDFGYSLSQYPIKVITLIEAALPWTIGLLLASTLIAFFVGTLLGAVIGWTRSPRFLRFLILPMLVFSSIPYYLLGLILVYALAVTHPVFPLSGGYSISTAPALTVPFVLDVARHALLPALSIVLAGMGFWGLGMRGMMVTTEGEDYMLFAEAKGLKGTRILLGYSVRNAILPQFTSLAIALGHIVSGSVIVEIVFGFPGVGSLLVKAISGSDYFLIYGIVFVIIVAIGIATLLIDLMYPLIDPRIAHRTT
ncbi:MAG: ABC transporter permease [Chloroflexi bacterium]|nr:ABC transporter permease [Chloroflexota bacterium]MBV9896981.1 ABC transporter permease [Chloroflexota bacterium]